MFAASSDSNCINKILSKKQHQLTQTNSISGSNNQTSRMMTVKTAWLW